MQVGEVRVAEDADFNRLRSMSTVHDDWKQDYNKNGTTVWTKANDVSDFKLIKIRAIFKDIPATTLYDVLHDPYYRKKWDTYMSEGYELCCLNPTNDIGYYCVKSPKPLKNRDFVIQRSWLETGKEYFIINHSVNHTSLPPRKGIIRGISYITGYYIVPIDDRKSTEPGCTITYVTQSDPKGKLPVWVVNKMTQIMAPKVMNRILKACRGYDAWKSKHNPMLKPWIYPEQITLPRLNQTDIDSMKEVLESATADETNIAEEDLKEEEELDMNGE